MGHYASEMCCSTCGRIPCKCAGAKQLERETAKARSAQAQKDYASLANRLERMKVKIDPLTPIQKRMKRSKERNPSTLAEQVAAAQAIYNSWPPEVRASVRLEGGDQ